jgi:hypothetical protein
LVRVPEREFHDTYSFFSEARQGIEELDYFVARLRSGDVVYDIGAFRGAYGVASKAAFGESVAVHLFEPILDNFVAIRLIGQINGFENFYSVNQALGSGKPVYGRKGSARSNASPRSCEW